MLFINRGYSVCISDTGIWHYQDGNINMAKGEFTFTCGGTSSLVVGELVPARSLAQAMQCLRRSNNLFSKAG